MHASNGRRNVEWPLRETSCFLLNVSYYYASLYAIENSYRMLHLTCSSCECNDFVDFFVLSHKRMTVVVHMTRLVALHFSWHSTSRGTSRLVAFHVLCHSTFCSIPRLVVLHVSWHSTSRGTSCLA